MSDLTDFLLARIADDEAPTWRLLPFGCPPGCCAPEGWVGHECLICDETSFGGTVDAITEISEDHDERIHRRSRVLAECEAKRRLIDWSAPVGGSERVPTSRPGVYDRRDVRCVNEDGEDVLRYLALPYVDHPDYREEWRP